LIENAKNRIQLERMAMAIAELKRRRRDHPLQYINWLPGQHGFLNDDSKRKLFRAGNQAHGKTMAGLAEIHWRCVGDHPFIDVPPGPIEAWCICASWSQSVHIQSKMHDLIGRTGDLVDDQPFDPKNGYGAKNPMIRYKCGSIVRFRTTQQGSINLAGATIDVAMFDEPPASPRIFSEVQKRLIRRNGTLILTLTPIGAPCDWLKEQVKAGHISETWVRLESENLIPVGKSEPLQLEDGSPMDQDWIDGVISETLPHEVGVICHGEWEIRTVGRVFGSFSEPVHITPDFPVGEVKLSLGMDWGDGANFSQVATLVAIDDSTDYPKLFVLDEYVSDGTTTIDMDAGAIIEMLRRNGLTWSNLDYVFGDRVWSGRRGNLSKKSNTEFLRAMGKLLKLPQSRMRPQIHTVKRGAGHGRGSLSQGCRFLHNAMIRPDHFHVNPRCTRLIDAFNRWDYSDDQWKHILDALRYSLDRWIFTRRKRLIQPVRLG
jgi:hypothetical protein